MKIEYLLLFGWAAVLIGCTDQNDEALNENKPQESLEIQFEGGIDQQYLSRVDDGGFCGGDQVGLYGVNYTDKNTAAGTLQNEGNQVDNVCYTYDEESMKWTSTIPAYYKDVNTCIDLYAYYPYAAPENVSYYKFEVAKDQNNNDGYAASDFLWAKAEKVSPSENKVSMRFTHQLACANVILTEGTGFAEGEFASLKKSVLVLNTTHTCNIDLATGVATPYGDSSKEGILMNEGADGFRAVVVPQSVYPETPMFAITVDGITYHFSKKEEFSYAAGMQSQFTIKINRRQMSGELEFELTGVRMVAWIADTKTHGGEARQYYVVHIEEPGTLGQLIEADKKNPNKIRNLKVTGNVDDRDFVFMRNKMAILQSVNMKECKICAYSTYAKEDEIPNSAFSGKTTLVYFSFPEKVTRINNYAFRNTLLSGALIIPDDVSEIGIEAFVNTCITSLSLPNNLSKIGNGAFQGCSSLTGNLHLPENLSTIGSSCFNACAFNGELIIPEKIVDIPQSCFSMNKFVGRLIIPETVKTIGSGAFASSGFTGSLILHDNLTTIASSAFSGCGFTGELRLPNSLEILEDYAFSACNFSHVIFPEELIKIGGNAFYNNKKLCGKVVFPDKLLVIENSAFTSCGIEEIVFPKNLTTIQSGAFSNCNQIQSITSLAALPPTIIGSAFPNLNITVKVPEGSVVDYQTSNGWSKFKFEGYHNFSLNSNLMRALNSNTDRTFTLTVPDNGEWSIDSESKPDWVTVSPTKGTGTQNVNVIVTNLTKGEGYREGEIKFKLDGKSAVAVLKVEQYDSEYADGKVITHYTSTKENGVNLVFMGDCFDAADIANGTYKSVMEEAIGHFFNIEPYHTYKNYFNVYSVVAMSPESGLGTENNPKEAKFNSVYKNTTGIQINSNPVFTYACKADEVSASNIHQTLVVVIENTHEYGSVSYLWNDGSAIAVVPRSNNAYPYDFRGVIQHEAGGHAFGKLGDEYSSTAEGSYYQGNTTHDVKFQHAKSLGWYANLAVSGDMSQVDWAHFMEHTNYQNIVNVYEGGYFHLYGIYRSEKTSCMANNIPYYSAVSRQAIVERIMEYAGEEFSLEDFYQYDVRDASLGNNSRSVIENPVYDNSYRQYTPRFMGEKPNLN